MKCAAVALMASVLGAVSVQAAVLESWESGANGWVVHNTNQFTDTPFSAFPTGVAGVTEGSHCAQVTMPAYAAGNWSYIQSDQSAGKWAVIGQNQLISIDITPVTALPAGASVKVGFDLEAGRGYTGWTRADEVALSPTGTTTVSVDYTKYPGMDMSQVGLSASGTISVYFNTGGTYVAQDFYVDNLRVSNSVPEPTVLSLLGLGGLALLRPRRA